MLICSTQWLTFIDICGSCRPSKVHTTGKKKHSSLPKTLESLPVVLEFSRKKAPGNRRDKNAKTKSHKGCTCNPGLGSLTRPSSTL